MSIPSIRGVVEAAIQRAASVTGADFGFLMGVARRESGYNPNAHARTSTAAGLFQFVDQTWLAALKRFGAKYGYARYADLIQRGADGRYFVPGAEARATVMALKQDPQAAALMAGELGASNAAYLRGRVGREPTAGELYLAHFLGPQGSARLIETVRTAPATPAAALFPDAAAANRPIFYRDGRATTVAEVYANLSQINGGPTRPARDALGPAQDASFTQYASARQAEAQAEEQTVVAMILRGPQGADDVGLSVRSAANGLFSNEMLRALSQAETHGRTS